MIEQVFKIAGGDSKVVEKVIQDENCSLHAYDLQQERGCA
jgi:hypothetical protein